MYYLEKDMTEALRTFTLGLETLKDYEVLRAQFNNVLDLLLPGDGQRPSPPPRPGLARPQGRGHHVDGGPIAGDGVRAPPAADLRVRRREGRRRGRAPARRLLVGHGHPGRDRPESCLTPPWRWSGSRDSKDRLRYGAGYSARIS